MRTLLLATAASLALAQAAWAGAGDADADAPTVSGVIVTASPDPDDPPVVARTRERLSRTPGAVAVVASETYDTRLVMGLPDLLNQVPGVLAQKRYGEESRLSIRGSGLDQSYHQRGVLIAQDGVPFADADGFSDFQKVDALGARYIEVYKGGNALRFGGAQLGGAVNLVTPTGRTADADDMVRVEGGSFGTIRGDAAVARSWADWDAYARVDSLHADGWRTNSGLDEVRGALNAGRRFGEDREVRLIAYGADINQDVPGTLTLGDALAHPRDAGSGVVANHWARDQQVGRVSLQTRWRIDDGLVLEGGLYSTVTSLHHPISLVIDQDINTQGAFARLDWTGAVAGHAADLFAGASYRQGANDQKLYVNAGGRRGLNLGDGHQAATGLDLFAEGRFFASPHLALVAGGSYGRATRDYVDHLSPANDARRDYDWLAPRVGLLWQGDGGGQVYANLTRSVEPPHFGALVQAPFPGFVPVDPQRAWTGEAGTRGRRGALTWDIALYRSEIDGELLSFSAAAGVPATFFNAGRTIHQGLEAGLDWRILDPAAGRGGLVLRQTYTFSDFHFDGDRVYGDHTLPVVPRHQYRAELRYDAPSGFFIAPAVEWRPSAVWVDYANTLKAPAYALLSLDAGWRASNGVELYVDARNLAGKRYVAEFGAVTDATLPGVNTAVFYPGEGRSLFAGVAYRF
jgi:iron complex outermembrane receptor protein